MTISEWKEDRRHKYLNIDPDFTLLPSYVALARVRLLKLSELDVFFLVSETLVSLTNFIT